MQTRFNVPAHRISMSQVNKIILTQAHFTDPGQPTWTIIFKTA